MSCTLLPAQESYTLDTRPLVWSVIDAQAVQRPVTISAGQDLTYPNPDVPVLRILVMDPANGEYIEMATVADTTGLSRPIAILCASIDATGGAEDAVVYIKGGYDENRLEFHAALTSGLDTIITGVPDGLTVRDALRERSLYSVNGRNTDIGAE